MEKRLETLRFVNPVFHPGVNCTVRLGEKWKLRVSPGDFVWLEQTDSPPDHTRLGLIKAIAICQLGDIPLSIFEIMHDPGSRTLAGLVMALRALYPELAGLDMEQLKEETVTILAFTVYAGQTAS